MHLRIASYQAHKTRTICAGNAFDLAALTGSVRCGGAGTAQEGTCAAYAGAYGDRGEQEYGGGGGGRRVCGDRQHAAAVHHQWRAVQLERDRRCFQRSRAQRSCTPCVHVQAQLAG
eukprot:1851813-Rhodomonas_salina.3